MLLLSTLLASLLLTSTLANAARLDAKSLSTVSAPSGTATFGPCQQTSYPVPNGDFEEGSLGPWKPNGHNTYVNVTSPGDFDSSALLIQGTGPKAYGSAYNRDIPVCAAARYGLSWVYRVNESAPGCDAAVEVRLLGHALRYTDFEITQTEGWQAGEYLEFSLHVRDFYGINAEINANYSASPDSCESAAIEFDTFELTYIKSLDAPGCPGTPYIQNGDFESGSLEPWNTSGAKHASMEIVSPGYDGSQFMARAEIAPYHNTTTNHISIYNFVNGVCVDYSYNITLAYRFNADIETIRGSCYIGVSMNYCTNFATLLDPVEGWQTFSGLCLATKNGVNETGVYSNDVDLELLVICQDGQDAPAFSVDFDDVQIELIQ